MAKLTREEVIDSVRRGEGLTNEDDLTGLDLSGANLSGAKLSNVPMSGTNLSGTNLSGTDLSEADLSDAYLLKANLRYVTLCGANLRDSNLDSVDFADADLSRADLTGTNIYNIATADWKIDGIKCEYVYNCKNYRNKEEKEKTRRDFAPGEFEQIYKSFPRLELIFKEGFSNLDHQALLAVINHIELELSDLKIRKFENVGNTTTVTLNAETNDTITKAAEMLSKLYPEVVAGLAEIKNRLVSQNPQLPSSLPDQWLTQLKGIIEQAIHSPNEVNCGNKSFSPTQVDGEGSHISHISWEIFYRIIAEIVVIAGKSTLPSWLRNMLPH